VPRIARFHGVAIVMYYNEHPPPHIHARHSEDEMTVQITPAQILEGALPPAVRRLVIEWVGAHAQALLDNWERAARHERLVPIEPPSS
jgi:hypothetical protein